MTIGWEAVWFMTLATLKQAFRADVTPSLAMARMTSGGGIDPVAAFRASGYASCGPGSARPHRDWAGASSEKLVAQI